MTDSRRDAASTSAFPAVLGREAVSIAVVAAAAALFVGLGWVGFLNSDDGLYLSSAEAWLHDFPPLPTAHWGFRYTLVLPLAALVGLAGSSETTLSVLAVAYYAALVAVVYGGARWFFGPRAAFASALLVATTPLFAVWASIVSIDIPETLFCLLALFLFAQATIDSSADPVPARRNRLLVAAGVAAAFGLVSRETAAGLALYLGLAFLLGLWLPRSRYLLIAAGAAAVLAIETGYYLLMGEGLLYRFQTIAATHGTLRLGNVHFNAGTGNVTDNRWLAPWLALFVNQEFGALFYVAVPAAIAVWRSRKLSPDELRLCRILTGFGIVWFLWISYGGAVRPLPRYYSVDAAVAAILIAVWMTRILPRRWAVLAGVLLLACNALSLSLENHNPRFAARQYVDYLAAMDEPIYTDPRTVSRASQHLAWRGLDEGRALSEIPPAGSLFLLDPEGLDAWNEERRAQGLAAVEIDPAWEEISRKEPPRRTVGVVIGFLHLDGFVPDAIRYRLLYGSPPVTLFRVKTGAPEASTG